MKALTRLQDQLAIWRANNFGASGKDENAQFLGVVEEVGELSHVLLKSKQSIRGWDDHTKRVAAKQDAVADITIFLMGFCDANGWDFGKLLEKTAKEVMERDWKKYPMTGRPPKESSNDD